MSEDKKEKRGGARPGAGRKATGRMKVFANTTISGTPEEIAEIKRLAKENGKTVSRYLVELALNQ